MVSTKQTQTMPFQDAEAWVSALLDGELDDSEAKRGLSRFPGDAEAAARWADYSLVSDALHGDAADRNSWPDSAPRWKTSRPCWRPCRPGSFNRRPISGPPRLPPWWPSPGRSGPRRPPITVPERMAAAQMVAANDIRPVGAQAPANPLEPYLAARRITPMPSFPCPRWWSKRSASQGRIDEVGTVPAGARLRRGPGGRSVAAQEAAAWLQASIADSDRYAYQGVFIHQHGSRMQTLQVSNRLSVAGKESRLIGMDGAQREVRCTRGESVASAAPLRDWSAGWVAGIFQTCCHRTPAAWRRGTTSPGRYRTRRGSQFPVADSQTQGSIPLGPYPVRRQGQQSAAQSGFDRPPGTTADAVQLRRTADRQSHRFGIRRRASEPGWPRPGRCRLSHRTP